MRLSVDEFSFDTIYLNKQHFPPAILPSISQFLPGHTHRHRFILAMHYNRLRGTGSLLGLFTKDKACKHFMFCSTSIKVFVYQYSTNNKDKRFNYLKAYLFQLLCGVVLSS